MSFPLLIFMLALLGSFTGLTAGLLGIGGGLVVVPGLFYLFQKITVIPEPITMHMAAGSSLGAMIITSLVSLQAHRRKSPLLWNTYLKLAPGIAFGTVVGITSAQWIPTLWLQRIFAIFLLTIAAKMLGDRNITQPERKPSSWLESIVSLVIGFKSGLLGVGGGILIIPFLTYCGIEPRKINAVSNMCTFTVALIGSIACIFIGWHDSANIPYALGFLYLPAVLIIALFSSLVAPLGVSLSYQLPMKPLQYLFIFMLIITAIKMLF